MAAGQYNFTLEQGSTLIKQFTYKDSNGTVVNLNGYTASMQIRPDINSETKIADFNSSILNGGLSIIPTSGSAISGTIQLNIHAESSSLYTFETAVYDIEIKSGDIVTRLLQGRIKLSKEVTR